MRRWNAWCMTTLLVMLPLEGLAALEPQCGELSLAAGEWLRFDIHYGRIRVTPTCRCVKGSFDRQEAGVSQSCAVSSRGGVAEFSYESTTDASRFQVRQCSDQLVVEHQTGDETVRYIQPRQGGLILEVRPADGALRRVSSDNLWSLTLACPEEFQQSLSPLLLRIRSDWMLLDAKPRLEEELLRISRGEQLGARDVRRLVGELGAPRFAARVAAERALWSLGPAVRKHLAALDRNQLTPEQIGRIAKLDARFRQQAESDHCERVAAWLSPDKATWLSLMQRDDEECRHAAFAQLRKISGDSTQLVFNPQASKSTREEQIAKLETQIAGRP